MIDDDDDDDDDDDLFEFRFNLANHGATASCRWYLAEIPLTTQRTCKEHNRHAMLLFAGLVLLAADPSAGLTIPWGADTLDDPILLPQCEDLTFILSGTNSIMQFQTKDKFERCDFNRSLPVLPISNNGAYTITGSSMGYKRGNVYFGSDFLDLCDQGMKIQVEIIPSFTAHMDTTCAPVEGRKPISKINVGSISTCERACVKKDKCLGFEFNPQANKDCMLFEFVPEPMVTTVAPIPETQAPTEIEEPTAVPATASPTMNMMAPETPEPTPAPTAMPTQAPTMAPTGKICVLPGVTCEVDDACCSDDNICLASRCVTPDPPTNSPTSVPSHVPTSSPTPAPSSEPTVCIAAGTQCTLDANEEPVDPCCMEGHVCMVVGSSARCVTSDAPTMMPTSSVGTGGNLRKRGRARHLSSEEDMTKIVVRRPVERALQQEPIKGAACYSSLSSCPKPPAPHCSINTKVTCAVFDDPSVSCKDAASLLPSDVTAGDDGCEIKLVYTSRTRIRTRTSDVSTTTWAKRTRKGGEPVNFARPREYDWLENEKIIETIPGAGTVPFTSKEEVIVDYCTKDTYKTLAEFVVVTDASTICIGQDQYKLDVKGL